jgi:hypothetical protein
MQDVDWAKAKLIEGYGSRERARPRTDERTPKFLEPGLRDTTTFRLRRRGVDIRATQINNLHLLGPCGRFRVIEHEREESDVRPCAESLG